MKTITVAELRQNPTEALEDVESGESYLVTRHRRPIARLVPVDDDPVEVIPARKSGGARLSERADLPRRSYAEIETLLDEMKGDR